VSSILIAIVCMIAGACVVALAAPLATTAHRRNDVPTGPVPPPSGRRRERVLNDAYPDALDLFVVTVQSGLLPFEALLRVRPHVHPIITRAIDDVAARVQQGQRLVDALDALVDVLGSRALSFVATIALAERTGLAVGPMIDRIADDARLHRRRRAEATARELPVRLAFPLVLCTLPSFVLVAIAPLIIGALSSLRST
jgi:tight adherence protein C